MLKCYVISLATTLLFFGAIGDVNLPDCAEEGEVVEVLVASKQLDVGWNNRLKEFRKVSLPEAMVPAHALFSLDGFRFVKVERPMVEGQIVLAQDTKLFDDQDMDIPEGYHAVSIPIENRNLPCHIDLLPGKTVDVHFDSKPASQHYESIKNVLETVSQPAVDISGGISCNCAERSIGYGTQDAASGFRCFMGPDTAALARASATAQRRSALGQRS